jgi:type I restriction enzyme S subunit
VPTNWSWTLASDVARIIGGGTPPTKDTGNFAGEGIPWIGPADLTGYKNVYIARGRRDLSEAGLARSGATMLPAGTVLFSSRAPIGYCAIAERPLATNQGFKSWICEPEVLPEYVRYYLLSSTAYIDSLASGTTFREVSGSRCERIAFPLPPRAEQRRIAAKLDALTARLARARAELSQMPVSADRFKKKMARKLIHSRPFATVPFLEACDAYQPKTVSKAELVAGGQYPVYGANGVIGLYHRFNHEHPQLLITCRGATCGAVNISKPYAWINGNAMVVDGSKGGLTLEFLEAYFADGFDFRSVISGTAQPQITRQSLATLRMPVISPDEQSIIVRQIKAAFARADRLEAEARRARALLDRLEAAILARAFRGELVPQDPEDEPASVLLERIRARRAAEPRAKRGRRTRETADA